MYQYLATLCITKAIIMNWAGTLPDPL